MAGTKASIAYREKGRPYEEDIRVPLLVRGPGVAAGSTLLEAAQNTVYTPRSPAYCGVRTSDSKYVAHEGGARELFKLNRHPYENRNSYKGAAPPAGLASRLHALKNCVKGGGRTAENGR